MSVEGLFSITPLPVHVAHRGAMPCAPRDLLIPLVAVEDVDELVVGRRRHPGAYTRPLFSLT
jgi:hypothetical protein